MKKIAFLLLVFAGILPKKALSQSMDELLSKYNINGIPYISVEELKMASMNGQVLIMDARENKEYAVSHLPKANFIGYNHFSIAEFSHKFTDKSTPIVVYCSVGIRSGVISEKIKDAGYLNVHNLYGGIFAWKNKGYSVFDSENQETNNVHTFSKRWSKYLKKGKKVY